MYSICLNCSSMHPFWFACTKKFPVTSGRLLCQYLFNPIPRDRNFAD